VPSREDGFAIASQYLERHIEILLGGGRKHFAAAQRKDERDLLAEFGTRGYAVCRTAEELTAAPVDHPCLGLFADSHLPFTLDQQSDAKLQKTVPTLAVMTQAALTRLERADRFILQVEGGRVDHACHNCDIAAAIHDQIALDEAIEVCWNFYVQHPDTLLVMTTDHGTGEPAISGAGNEYEDSYRLLARVKGVKRSFPEILKLLTRSKTPAAIAEVISGSTGLRIATDQAALLQPFLEKKGQALFSGMKSDTAQLGQLLAAHLGVGWVSGSHTGDHAPLVAVGPGAELFRGFMPNTDIFKNYLQLAGVSYRNPVWAQRHVPLPFAVAMERVEEYQFA